MIDLLIVLAFVAYAVRAGFASRKEASQNLREYFLAGNTISGWRAGFSMAATQFAADTPLLVMGLIASGGVFLLWQLWVYGITFLMMGFLIAALWRRAGVLTDAELTEIRYSGPAVLPLRVLKAVYFGTVINCVVMAFVLVAAVRIAEVFMPWHLWLPALLHQPAMALITATGLDLAGGGTQLDPVIATANNLITILVLLLFTMLYSVTGGLRSVIATDVLQFALAMAGTLVYAIIVVDQVGGLDAIGDRLEALYGAVRARQFLSFAPSGTDLFAPFLILLSLQWFFNKEADGTGYLAQRAMSCRTDEDARMAVVVFTFAQIVVRSLLWVIIGVGLLILYPFEAAEVGQEGFKAARELVFVSGIEDYLPIGLRGLMLTALLAALASTIDTHLNWGASYWANDIYKRLICEAVTKRQPSNRELVLVARLSNVLILAIALAIMAQLGSIQEGWKISLLFGAGMGAVLVLRWVWDRITVWSELAAIGVSLVTGIWLLQAFPDGEQEWLRLGLMALISTAAAVGVTFFTPPTQPDRLMAFYRRVRPMGFWGRTAQAAGDPADQPLRRLGLGIRNTILAAVSMFCCLVGLTKLFLPLPDDSAFLPLALLALGLAMVPFWIGGVRPYFRRPATV